MTTPSQAAIAIVSLALDECGRGTVKINGQDVLCKEIIIKAGVERITVVTVTLLARVEADVSNAVIANAGEVSP